MSFIYHLLGTFNQSEIINPYESSYFDGEDPSAEEKKMIPRPKPQPTPREEPTISATVIPASGGKKTVTTQDFFEIFSNILLKKLEQRSPSSSTPLSQEYQPIGKNTEEVMTYGRMTLLIHNTTNKAYEILITENRGDYLLTVHRERKKRGHQTTSITKIEAPYSGPFEKIVTITETSPCYFAAVELLPHLENELKSFEHDLKNMFSVEITDPVEVVENQEEQLYRTLCTEVTDPLELLEKTKEVESGKSPKRSTKENRETQKEQKKTSYTLPQSHKPQPSAGMEKPSQKSEKRPPKARRGSTG